jgi:hypothetical protein
MYDGKGTNWASLSLPSRLSVLPSYASNEANERRARDSGSAIGKVMDNWKTYPTKVAE